SDCDLGAFAGAVANEAVGGGILVVERNLTTEKSPIPRNLAALLHRCLLLTQLAQFLCWSCMDRARFGSEWQVANGHSIRHSPFAIRQKTHASAAALFGAGLESLPLASTSRSTN